ncbi:MAG: hypothetical protein GF375_02530, partial [Candidatus Omnitrophica bacterium]|nr:hypothetical protein [Candidatus Omnitrophota bacterium]MBD3268977.1 hypothetical protein [Candidatus Omnitrophota bacterium]
MKMRREIKLKNYNLGETVAAIATFPSPSALGVIKVSGRRSLSIINKIFLPKKKKSLKKCRTFTIHYGWIKAEPGKKKSLPAGRNKHILDEVLVSIMRA